MSPRGKPAKEPMVRVTVMLPKALVERIDAKAGTGGRSAEVVRRLRQWESWKECGDDAKWEDR